MPPTCAARVRRGPLSRPRASGLAAVAGVLVGLASAGGARAADPTQGALQVLRTVPTVTGDLLGGTGLLAAAALATAGDAIALVDRNPVTHGWISRSVHCVAEGTSWLGTQALEGLRAEDVERWPEAPATYRQADPFTGRLDTTLSGAGALRLALTDVTLGPVAGLVRIASAGRAADRVERVRREQALYYLGPPPLAAVRTSTFDAPSSAP